jgi:hypothetical protein
MASFVRLPQLTPATNNKSPEKPVGMELHFRIESKRANIRGSLEQQRSSPVALSASVKYSVERIGTDSPLFTHVLTLHAASKARLGPLPLGAFEELAERKQILIAATPEGSLVGYLLYRVAKNRVAITHLTSAERFRGTGVANLLLDRLKQDTKHLLGISLCCRRDYGLDRMWARHGFTVRHSKRGRGGDGAMLDIWWFSHNHEDLFSLAARGEDATARVTCAIDANIFYDLTVEDRAHGEDTRVLEADWLEDSLALCITPELFNEIGRGQSEDDRRRSRGAAQGFRELRTDEMRVRHLESELKPLFNEAVVDRDGSDMRQIAHAIAAEVPFFVTRDAPMLAHAEIVFERYGLRIIHPTDLIVRLDSLRREAEYRPARLEGSRWRERLVTDADIKRLSAVFQNPNAERIRDFERRLRHHLAHPGSCVCRVATDERDEFAVLFVETRGAHGALEIPFLRHSDHPLAGTLVRHILHSAVLDTAEGAAKLISITDDGISAEAVSAMQELGFLPDGDRWWKLSIVGVLSQAEVSETVQASALPAALRMQFALSVAATPAPSTFGFHCERVFAPLKVIDAMLPTFVISIRPDWAEQFFDAPIGAQLLMDLNEKLHLGIEGAYYCSPLNTHLIAPARVLWYVSKGPSGCGSMSVKACSHLAELVVGKPKELFRRFRHLGVYAWRHVFEAASENLDNELIAFRFSRTERFARPVSLAEIKELGVPQPVNPRRISDDQFTAIYRLGMNHR